MPHEVVGLLAFVVLILLIATGLPIAFCFIVISLFGLAYIQSFGVAMAVLRDIPFRWSTNYDLAAVPLFVLMATLIAYGGVATSLYDAAAKWLGRVRGSLAMSTVVACGIFAAVSGSSVATAGAIGRVALPEMQRQGYDGRLAAGSAAAGGTLGILIPPSIPFIIYGLLVEESIGKLFIAGILPGILEIIVFIATIGLLVWRYPGWAPLSPPSTMKEKLSSLLPIWTVVVLVFIIMGGIYGGIFTPTEAGGIGVVAGFLIVLINRKFKWKNFVTALLEAGVLTCSIYVILIGAMMFSRFLLLTGTTNLIAQVANVIHSPMVLIIFIMLVYLFLGCFMNPIAMIILTIPIFLPLLNTFNIDLIWFGVLAVVMQEIGNITPPVGLNLFTIRAVNPDIPTSKIMIGSAPFLIADLVCLAILIIFPQISLVLPTMMKGY